MQHVFKSVVLAVTDFHGSADSKNVWNIKGLDLITSSGEVGGKMNPHVWLGKQLSGG